MIRSNHMERETGFSPEQPTPDFSQAQDWFELFDLVKQAGTIHGSKNEFTPEKIIDLITKVCASEISIHNITTTGGLRKKVIDLIIEQGIPPSPDDRYRIIKEIDPTR